RQRGFNVSTICNVRIPTRGAFFLRVLVGLMNKFWKVCGCMLCLINSRQRFVLLVLVDVIYLSFFQFFCQ
uniref:hypothetical protein n=1 Tax=Corynebacterium jeikeium TaxID=38289 RepID=UPI001ED9AE15